jgi:hypothetical protein
MILAPIYLVLGINPIVTTATTSFLVLLITSATSLQFIFNVILFYFYSYLTYIYFF